MRPICPWLLVFASLAIACGGDDDDDSGPDACGVETALPGTGLDEVSKLGSVSLQERPTEGGPIERFATGAFLDFSLFDADDAPTLNFDEVCSSVVGDQVIRTAPTRLQAPTASVSIDGSSVDFEQVGEGQILASGLGDMSSGDAVGLSVTGGDGAEDFPSFTAEVSAPAAPSSLTTERASDGALIVHWARASAEAIEIEIRTVDAVDDTRIRCVVADDGCLTVSTTAVSWLAQSIDPVPMNLRVAAVGTDEWVGPDSEIGFFKVERRRDTTYSP